MGFYQSLAFEVSLAGYGKPDIIYETWYPNQLVSIYTLIVNRNWREKYLSLEDKEKAKHPEVIVERLLSREEAVAYSKQQKRNVAKKLSTVK